MRLRGRVSSSRPNFVFAAEFRLQGRISSSRPNFVFRAEFRLRGRISSSGPNFVFAAEFRLQGGICLQGRISSSRPNIVFRAEFRLRGRISSSRLNIVLRTEFRLQGRISSSGPNFVFRAEFRLRGRISSSGPNFVFRADFRLRGRISSSPCPKPNFVFTGISSSWPIFVFKFRLRAQFELQLLGNKFVFKSFGISASGGGYETGTHFPGSMQNKSKKSCSPWLRSRRSRVCLLWRHASHLCNLQESTLSRFTAFEVEATTDRSAAPCAA